MKIKLLLCDQKQVLCSARMVEMFRRKVVRYGKGSPLSQVLATHQRLIDQAIRENRSPKYITHLPVV